MTVSTPSFVFPHNFEGSTVGKHGEAPCNSGQWQYGNRTERPRSDTGSSVYGNYSLDPAETISNALEKMLESNGHFVRARMVAEQRAVENARLQEMVNTHAKENNDLKVQVETLKDALALFANDYHEGSHTTGRVLTKVRSENPVVRPALKKRKDFPPVCLWTRKEFRSECVSHANAQRGETDGDATSVRGIGRRGRPRKGSDKDNKPTHFYLENADRVPVSEEQIAEMSRKARMLWRSLNRDGLASQSFGQILMRAWEYYSSVILADKAFDFLLLCDDGEWKLREWSTRSYPSWYRNRFTKDANDELEKDSIRDIASVSSNTGTREHPTENGDKDNNAPEIDGSTGANNSDDLEERPMASDLNDSACGTEAAEATGIQMVHPPTGTTAMDTGAPSTPLLMDPFAADPAPPASDIPDSTPHASGPSNSLVASTAPSTNTSVTGSLATLASVSSTASQQARTPSTATHEPRSTNSAVTDCADDNVPASTPQAPFIRICLCLNHLEATECNKRKSDVNSSKSSAKKQKRVDTMAEPTAANSIRNICMRHWKEMQPRRQGLLSDFDSYFKLLSDTDKEPFKNEMQAAQSAARKVTTAAKKVKAP